MSGVAGDFGLGPYNASKAGVVNITRVFAIEYGRKHIRCNAVLPGPIGTPPLLARKETDPETMGKIEQAIPMGRLGTPGDGQRRPVPGVGRGLVRERRGLYRRRRPERHSGMPSLTGIYPDFN